MKLRNSVIVVAAVAMAATLQTARANLAGLIGGGSITTADGSLTFSGFGLSGDPTLVADAGTFTVSTINQGGINYLSFSGAFIGVSGISSADLTLSYTVTANGGGITMIDQKYTPDANNFVGAGDQIIIGETASGHTGSETANSTLTLQPLDLSDPVAEPGDNLNFGTAQTVVDVSKDFLFTSGNLGDTVGLSVLDQSFHTVPEPTTVIAGALLLLPLGASTLRILRRNRIG